MNKDLYAKEIRYCANFEYSKLFFFWAKYQFNVEKKKNIESEKGYRGIIQNKQKYC